MEKFVKHQAPGNEVELLDKKNLECITGGDETDPPLPPPPPPSGK